MLAISDWYTVLGDHTFPTVFVRLQTDEVAAFLAREADSAPARRVIDRLHKAIRSLPGSSFVGADVCAPTDNPGFRHGSVSSGRAAWELLAGSEKVQAAFREGRSERFTVRPYRRMDLTREFRLFVFGRELKAASQRRLDRHYRRLAKRQEEIWQHCQNLAQEIVPLLPTESLTVDVYLTSARKMLVVDLNPWGPPTDPLLLRAWDRDWHEVIGLKLIPQPIQMKGDVSVSF